MPKAKFSIFVRQISLFSLLGLLVAENTVVAEGRRSECQMHHHLMSPWPQRARHVERTEVLSVVTEHHAQISPFPVLHVSHMLCVCGGGGGKFQICMLAVDMLASTACCSQLMRWMQVVGVGIAALVW